MLYKYISEIPFRVNDIPVINLGDTIALAEDNTIKNVTTGKSFQLDQHKCGQDLNYILLNSAPIDDVNKSDDDMYSVEAKRDRYVLSKEIYDKLKNLGILDSTVRNSNVGNSDYSKHIIQPWSIWIDYDLNPWDADIVKRVLRTKKEPGKSEIDSRIMDYKKIIHICKERIRQLKTSDEIL